MKKLFLPLGALAIILLQSSCYYDKRNELYPEVCDTTTATFSAVVQPIFNNNCAISGCHTGSNPAAGFTLTDYSSIKSAIENGRVMGAINHDGGFTPMPQGADKISDCKINSITNWINAGLLNN